MKTNPPRLRRLAASGVLAAALAVPVIVAVAAGLPGGSALPGAAGALPPPRFVEEGHAAGIEHAYAGGFEFYVGGGVAVFDCNGDAMADLYFAGGSSPAALFANRSPQGGSLEFARVSAPEAELERVTGAYPLDIDGDGNVDLAVLRYGENVLLRGLGGCRFERANEAWHFDGGDEWSTAFSATWERGAEWPTLAVGNYLDDSSTTYTCFDNQLFRPAPTGSAFAAPTPLRPGWCTLSMLFSSWDRSGRADLRVSNDRHYYTDLSEGQEQLWRIAPAEQAREYGAADGWQPVRIWGMGIASDDLTGDGYPEYYLTSQADNKLQTLADGPRRPAYRDIAMARGATVHRPFTGADRALPSTAWHAQFADVNNDGWMDLYVAKGNVEAQAGYAAEDPSNLLLGQPDGTFVEGADAAGIIHFGRTRGAALVDLNADGMLDLVEVNRLANVKLWRNVGGGTASAASAMGNWLDVRLEQHGANRHAVGAWVEIRWGERTIAREMVVGGGHAGGQLGALHFGLASADAVELRVTWPDGEVGTWQRVAANQQLTVQR